MHFLRKNLSALCLCMSALCLCMSTLCSCMSALCLCMSTLCFCIFFWKKGFFQFWGFNHFCKNIKQDYLWSFRFFYAPYLCGGGSGNLVNPIISQFSKFWILGVVIHPDVGHKILRPMVKELALYDLRFLSYGQKTPIFGHFWKNCQK